MPTILSRTAWTSTANGRAGRPLSRTGTVAITCHYPADSDKANYSNLSKAVVAAMLRAYRDYHMRVQKWVDIGYNYAIDQAGRIWDLTGANIGAHAGNAGNPTSFGVLFVVGNLEELSKKAIKAFRWLRAHLMKTFTKATQVQGHQQVPGNATACPGQPIMTAIRSGTLIQAPGKPEAEKRRNQAKAARAAAIRSTRKLKFRQARRLRNTAAWLEGKRGVGAPGQRAVLQASKDAAKLGKPTAAKRLRALHARIKKHRARKK